MSKYDQKGLPMKKVVYGVAALALTSACVLKPKGVTDEDLTNFDAAVASIGCTLETERHYLPVELQTGLTRELLTEVAQFRLAREEAVSTENGGVTLVTGTCAPKTETAAAT